MRELLANKFLLETFRLKNNDPLRAATLPLNNKTGYSYYLFPPRAPLPEPIEIPITDLCDPI